MIPLLTPVPVTLVVLGAFFYSPPDPAQGIALPVHDDAHTHKKRNPILSFFQRKLKAVAQKPGNPNYPGENRAVFVAVISRMVIVPAILLPAVALMARYDPFTVTEDPVFILAAVLLISSVRISCYHRVMLMIASCFDLGPNHPSCFWGCIREVDLEDYYLVVCRLDSTVSVSYRFAETLLTCSLTILYVVLGLVFGRL